MSAYIYVLTGRFKDCYSCTQREGSMRFEWDEKKNRLNRKKHGILFQLASEAFEDPFRLLTQTGR